MCNAVHTRCSENNFRFQLDVDGEMRSVSASRILTTEIKVTNRYGAQ